VSNLAGKNINYPGDRVWERGKKIKKKPKREKKHIASETRIRGIKEKTRRQQLPRDATIPKGIMPESRRRSKEVPRERE